MHPFLNIGIQAARNASKILLRYVDRLDAVTVSEKAHNDLVTEADKWAEQEIIETIRKAYPQHSILGEEAGLIEGNEYCWVIDPLDGTTNYIHGFPHFSISIAVKHHDKIEVGIIYDPLRQELFTAVRGEGAQLNHRRLRVSKAEKLKEALIGTGMPVRHNEYLAEYIKIFSALLPQIRGIRRAGSAALDLAYIAAGRLDGFWEMGLKEWDIAAGMLMIKEAGGMVSDFKGEEQFQQGNIVGGNLKMFKELLKVIAAAK